MFDFSSSLASTRMPAGDNEAEQEKVEEHAESTLAMATIATSLVTAVVPVISTGPSLVSQFALVAFCAGVILSMPTIDYTDGVLLSGGLLGAAWIVHAHVAFALLCVLVGAVQMHRLAITGTEELRFWRREMEC
ncbi:hypothetical protein AcV5_000310 [Taiwanofungus camphoratus]|nr:hypothetical protein AcV5_000310 [Antrodia cinnamomea]